MPRTNSFLNKNSNIVNTARSVIYNKYVLYVVFFAALMNLLYSAVNQDYVYCVIFVLVGFLIAFFNKNMTVILTLTVAISTILRNVLSGRGLKIEGFEEPKEDDEDKKNEKTVQEPFKKEGNENKGNENKEDSSKEMAKRDSVKKDVNKNPNPTKTQLMDTLKTNALDLQEAQKEIISGFEKIEPYMDKAESLIEDIQKTALTIQGMKDKQTTK